MSQNSVHEAAIFDLATVLILALQGCAVIYRTFQILRDERKKGKKRQRRARSFRKAA